MPLLTLPSQVIKEIAYWSANSCHDYLLPPTDVISLASTCHDVYSILFGSDEDPDYTVLADIARHRYSMKAALRRLGSAAVTDQHVIMELKIRVPALRRVRRGDPCSPHLVADLWVVYYMCIEDDNGNNIQQLDYADTVLWVSRIIARIPVGHDRRPLETAEAHLAIAIYALLSLRFPSIIMMCQSKSVSDAVERIINGFALAPYQMSRSMIPLPSPVRLPNPLWGHIVYASYPSIAVSAALCFLAIWTDFDGTHPHDFQTMSLNSELFDADYWRLILSYIPLIPEAERKSIFTWSPDGAQSSTHPASASVHLNGTHRYGSRCMPFISKFFDADYWRQILSSISAITKTTREPILPLSSDGSQSSQSSTHSASASVDTSTPSVDTDLRLSRCWYGNGRLWAPGMLTGEWVGEDDNTGARPLAWYLDPSSNQFPRMKLSLREHVGTVIGRHTMSFTGDWPNGISQDDWICEVAEEIKRSLISEDTRRYQLSIFDPSEPDYGESRYFTVTHARDKLAPPHKNTSHNGYGVSIRMPSSGQMPMFLPSKSSPSGGTSAACSVEPPSEPFDLPEGLELDVVITGELMRRKKQYHLFGRIRKSDGFIVLVATPASNNNQRIFHGYLVGGSLLVGRWRNALVSYSSDETVVFKRNKTSFY